MSIAGWLNWEVGVDGKILVKMAGSGRGCQCPVMIERPRRGLVPLSSQVHAVLVASKYAQIPPYMDHATQGGRRPPPSKIFHLLSEISHHQGPLPRLRGAWGQFPVALDFSFLAADIFSIVNLIISSDVKNNRCIKQTP